MTIMWILPRTTTPHLSHTWRRSDKINSNSYDNNMDSATDYYSPFLEHLTYVWPSKYLQLIMTMWTIPRTTTVRFSHTWHRADQINSSSYDDNRDIAKD